MLKRRRAPYGYPLVYEHAYNAALVERSYVRRGALAVSGVLRRFAYHTPLRAVVAGRVHRVKARRELEAMKRGIESRRV